MNKYIVCLLYSAVLAFSSLTESFAQIKYMDGGITIGDVAAPYYHYGITANLSGAYFMGEDNNFFQLDITPITGPCIAGYNHVVMFSNASTGVMNAIEVAHIVHHSDLRAKTDIKSFDSGIEVITRLRPVSYNFLGTQKRSAPSNEFTGNNVEIGLIAQEVENILPNLVYTDDQGRKLVDYTSLIPVLIDAVQTLQQEIEDLKTIY